MWIVRVCLYSCQCLYVVVLYLIDRCMFVRTIVCFDHMLIVCFVYVIVSICSCCFDLVVYIFISVSLLYSCILILVMIVARASLFVVRII